MTQLAEFFPALESLPARCFQRDNRIILAFFWLDLDRRIIIPVEQKVEIVSRIGRSPDRGDAAVLALADTGPAPLRLRAPHTLGAYDPHRPLFKFTGEDAARTQWYVSSTTGEIAS